MSNYLDKWARGWEGEYATCEDCNGDGCDEDGDTCEHCQGTGAR